MHKVTVDIVTFDSATSAHGQVQLSATNTATVPTLSVSFYGFDTKDFYISAHTRDGGQLCKDYDGHAGMPSRVHRRREHLGVPTDDNPLFTEVATGTPGTWEVDLDLTKYVQPNSTDADHGSRRSRDPGADRRWHDQEGGNRGPADLAVGGQTVAIDAVSKTVDLNAGGAFVDNYFQGTNDLAPVKGATPATTSSATTFH